jgi:uncharacterized caspase-like protein
MHQQKSVHLRLCNSLLGTLALVLFGCVTVAPSSQDDFEIVDCEIPGQVLRLGTVNATTGRSHALRTGGSDCTIRGGYYVVANAANYETSLKVWQPRAEAGETQAQYFLGRIYERGLGREPNFALAAIWYKKAAASGHAAAMTALAGFYERGDIGGAANATEALDLYRRAANLNEPLAFARDLRARESEIEALRSELNSAREQHEKEIESLKRQINRRTSELEKLEEELKRTTTTQQASAAEAAALRRQIGIVEAALREERQRLSRSQAEVKRVQAAADALATAREAQPVATEAPSIALVEPIAIAMRGLTTVRVATGQRDVALKFSVKPSANIASVSIDDRPVSVDTNGMVSATIAIRGNTTPMSIRAVDRQGRRGELAVVLVSADLVALPSSGEGATDFGQYHALVIGNSRYREWDKLNSPRYDAMAVSDVLRHRYGFRVHTLFDATRQEVIRELARMRSTLSKRDNLLIYYAGHGHWDHASQRGYWIPVDGDKTNPANWISSADVTDQLSVVLAKQVLVIADSCYSGVFVDALAAQLDRAERQRDTWLLRRAQMRSRKVMSSGNIAQVMDGGAGNNSVFARQLIDALTQKTEPFEAQELHREITPRITQLSRRTGTQQDPQYGPLRYAGHEAGDFVFLPKR